MHPLSPVKWCISNCCGVEKALSELLWECAGFMRQLELFVDNSHAATKESSDDD